MNRKTIAYICLIVLLTVLVVGALKQGLFNSTECSDNCVTIREDPNNVCSWQNGQMTSGTDVSTNPNEYIYTQVPKDQLDTYLNEAYEENKCIFIEE